MQVYCSQIPYPNQDEGFIFSILQQRWHRGHNRPL